MIKKKLGLLAGSLLAATSSQAAITFTGDTLAVFSTAGQGTYYQSITNSTGDTLRAGEGFIVDVSAASSALGGSIEQFAILALAKSTATGLSAYNYTEFLYVEVGGGLVYVGGHNDLVSSTNHAAQNQVIAIQTFLQNANLGSNAEGSLGDFDSVSATANLLTTNHKWLIINEQTLGDSTNPKFIDLIASPDIPGLIRIEQDTLIVTGAPIPAAAWLFGSALIGLGVAKRKSQQHEN